MNDQIDEKLKVLEFLKEYKYMVDYKSIENEQSLEIFCTRFCKVCEELAKRWKDLADMKEEDYKALICRWKVANETLNRMLKEKDKTKIEVIE